MNCSVEKVTTESNLNKCLEIREKVFIIEKNVPREIENDEFDRICETCEHFLVFDGEKPVGTVRMRFLDESTVKLQRFCFLKEFRGLGFGSKTIEYIESRYKSLGKNKIVIEAKYDVSQFYEKCGYKRVSDIFLEVGVEHINMEKEI